MDSGIRSRSCSVQGKNGRVPVQILIDAQGTSFLQLNPLDVLTRWEQDIYFMGEPGLGDKEDQKHLQQIIRKYGLQEIASKIMQEPNYCSYPDIKKLFYLGDRLCYEYLKREGLTDAEISKLRGDISAKVYYLADKELFKNIRKEFPDVKIYVISQAGQYMLGAFEKLLAEEKYSDVDVIVAPNEQMKRYTKMDPQLYSLISQIQGIPASRYGLLDDKQMHVNAAKIAGMFGKLHDRGNSQQLLDNSISLIREIEGYHRSENGLWVPDRDIIIPSQTPSTKQRK